MTRAKDISKILTDGNISGTLDVSGAFTSLGIDDNADATAITIDSSERVMIGTTTEGNVGADDLTIATTGNTGITIRSGTTHNGGIYFSDGTSGADEYRGYVDYDHNGNNLNFATNAVERMRILSDGKIGINTTAPTSGLTVEGVGLAVGSGCTASGTAGSMAVGHASSATGARSFVFGREMTVSGDHSFGIALSDQNGLNLTANNTMAIMGGNLLVGCTALPSGGAGGAGFEAGQSSGRTVFQLGTTTTSQLTVQRFYNPNGNVGEIKTSGSSTIYATSSDHRLKENVTADWDATTRLKQLNPVRFNFIADADTTVDGFLAHEVQSVVPEAITGTHNEVDDDGNPVYQGIDQSKLVPLLVKTIQELEARIVALETA